MSTRPQIFHFGEATVTLINTGDLRTDTAGGYKLPAGAAALRSLFPLEPVAAPVQCIHIQLPGVSALIDPSVYDLPPDSPFIIPGYQPPPPLLEQLHTAGIQAEGVEHVIITHPHFDHFNGLTLWRNGGHEAAFPNARHYIGRADWEGLAMQTALQNPESLESKTLGLLHARGLLETVKGEMDLGHGVRILTAPGETPGHQMVRVQSGNESLYCLGDLYHNEIEVEHPELVVHWADSATTPASRRALATRALRENAWLIATHILGVGRLQPTTTGVRWARPA